MPTLESFAINLALTEITMTVPEYTYYMSMKKEVDIPESIRIDFIIPEDRPINSINRFRDL